MTKEEKEKIVSVLKNEQMNLDYIDPEAGGLYSDEFIADFDKFLEQMVEVFVKKSINFNFRVILNKLSR